ncbi:MAG: hypothetical protein K2O86_02220 [Clostridia bacterium]|nr:hypothetical protein [Clostridia bacterium]
MTNGRIKINELPETPLTKDSDIFIIENDTSTQKISLGSLINYIKEHEEIAEHFVKQSAVDSKNGVAPLDGSRKIPSANLPFGSTENTVYDGARGQALTDAHSALKESLTALEESFHTTTENLQEQINTIGSKGSDLSEIENNISKINTSIANINQNTSQLFTITDKNTVDIAKIPLYGEDFSSKLIPINSNYHIYLTRLNNGLVQIQLQASNVTLTTTGSTSIAFLPTLEIFFNTHICVPYFVSTGAGMQFCVLSMGSGTYNNQTGTMFSITGLKDAAVSNVTLNFSTLIK